MNSNTNDRALVAARGYLERGWRVVPIPPGEKGIRQKGWQLLRLTASELPCHFKRNCNVGVLLGEPSGWLIDVDLDHPLAVELAPVYLPPTQSIFGRDGKPRSHFLFRAERPVETKKWTTPKQAADKNLRDKMIVELRSTGCQTVFPGSVHPSGEKIRWECDGEPAGVDPELLAGQLQALHDEVLRRLGLHAEPGADQQSKPGEQQGPAPADVIERARAYLAKIPAAVSGQTGHDSTFNAACVLVLGFGLSRENALALLQEWNQSCQPPWSDKELAHKIDDALKQPGERGYLLRRSAGGESNNSYASSGTWPEPRPLPCLASVEPFGLELLPESLRPWIADIAERMQCPVDYPAVAAVVGLGSLVGRKIGIRPKRYDDWFVVPNLWGGVVGKPSLLKTPALAEPKKMLDRLEANARKEFEALALEHKAAQLVVKVTENKRNKEIAKAAEDGADAKALAMKWLSAEQDEPVRRRYVLNDATVEKLGAVLNENPNGVLVYRDEMVGWLKSLDKEGQEPARAFYLEAWNGTGRFTYDRIARGTIDIEACCVSILGGIQPGPLRAYLRDAIRGGRGDDGLVQRLQLLVWPDHSGTWKNVDRWPDTASKQAAWGVYQSLDQLDPLSVCAHDDGDGILYLRFTDDGQLLFDSWRADLEHRLRAEDGEADALLAHLGKYRSLVPSLALLFHLAEGHVGDVDVAAIERAIGWVCYLESHAVRLYGALTDPQFGPARGLAAHIMRGDLVDGFSLRDVYQHHWSSLDTRDDAKEAIDVLVDLDWLRAVESVSTGGRPSLGFQIHPQILAQVKERGRKSGKGQPDEPSAPFATPASETFSNSAADSNTSEVDWGIV